MGSEPTGKSACVLLKPGAYTPDSRSVNSRKISSRLEPKSSPMSSRNAYDAAKKASSGDPPTPPLDLSSDPKLNAGAAKKEPTRPYLGIQFRCCRVYARIYLNHDSTAFAGNCPRCARAIRVEVSEDGVDQRFFSAQ